MFWPRPAIMRHDPGLAASPPVRYRLKVEGSAYSPATAPLRGCGLQISAFCGARPQPEIRARCQNRTPGLAQGRDGGLVSGQEFQRGVVVAACQDADPCCGLGPDDRGRLA